MTEDNKDQLSAKDLLVAYFDVDYKRNPKGSNYWRNRWVGVGGWGWVGGWVGGGFVPPQQHLYS